jgi:HK97 gp10 family phage protein
MSFDTDATTNWNGEAVKLISKRVISESLFEIGLVVEGQAKLLSPVDLGRLRGSITVQMSDRGTEPDGTVEQGDIIQKPTDENTAFVGTAVDYAAYQEFGTVKMNAQPYLRPALDIAQGRALNIVMDNGKREFAEYLK